MAPEFFTIIVEQLAAAGLIHDTNDTAWSRVIIEKPFGHDLESARALNVAVTKVLDESQIYRIDHYLGKETVQNILCFRFGNSIFEPLFNQKYVDNVQITVAETLGMEGRRGAYYDTAGTMRDMVQNHMLQLLCLIAMEPPSALDAQAIRDEKVKVLRALDAADAEGGRGLDGARPVRRRRAGRPNRQGLPPGGRRRSEVDHRDLRRAAHQDRQLALGGRAVPAALRQAARQARLGDRRTCSSSRRCISSASSTTRATKWSRR